MSPPSGSSGAGSSSGSLPTDGDDGGDDASTSNPTSDSGRVAEHDASSSEPPPAMCIKGQVTANEVVMIGDSYLDPNYGNVGPNIVADAQKAGVLAAGTKYREYYLAGAAMNNGAAALNIPYQYDTNAKGDFSVANPKDIQLVIMDGGGNDVLIDQQSCLMDATSAAQMADAPCMNAVTNTVARTKALWQEMAGDGVKQIVYFFYPHLDPGGGGLLPTPSPGVNLIDDYSAPLYQQICCGSSFTPTATAYSCSGNAPGTKCTFVDTRPAFQGHSGALGEPGPDYILSDHVHPNATGSVVIANLVWDTMVANCIGQ
jgi:lysophospholipase L1-like esterase